jgi:hypothetical protein
MPGKHGPASDMNGDIVADHALRCAKDDDRSCLPREKTQPRMLHGAVGVRPGQFPSSRFAALGPTRETQHGAAAVFGSQGEDGHNRATARRPPSRARRANAQVQSGCVAGALGFLLFYTARVTSGLTGRPSRWQFYPNHQTLQGEKSRRSTRARTGCQPFFEIRERDEASTPATSAYGAAAAALPAASRISKAQTYPTAMPSLPHFCVCLKNLKSGGG